MNFTHRWISTTAAFLTFHHGTMDVREHGVRPRSILHKLGDNGMNVGNCYMYIDREFGLGMQS